MVVDELFAPEVLRAITRLGGAPDAASGSVSEWLRMRRRAARVLSEVGVQPGMRVLELGTGSGWSACLLAELAGPGGSVISVDPDRRVTDRAREVRGGQGLSRLMFQTWQLRAGWPLGAPYDLVISWRCVARLPAAWLRQCIPPTATVVTPVAVVNAPGVLGLLRVGVDEERQPIRAHLLPDLQAGGAGCGTATAVRLHGDPDGYTVHLPPESARTATTDRFRVEHAPCRSRRVPGR